MHVMVVRKAYLPPVVIALVLAPAHGLAREALPGPVPAEVERVIDGDTVRVLARIWVGHTVSVAVRVAGVDAPELYRPRCDAERALARRAKAFVEAMLGGGAVTLLDVVNDKYGGRVVARIVSQDGRDVGEALLAEGLAIETGGADPWC